MENHGSNAPPDAWTRGGGTRFGAVRDSDEELHGKVPEAGDSLTETWAYMFCAPASQLSAFVYIWAHPNLDLVTGGLTVWLGHKVHHLQAELFDIRAFVSSHGRFAGNGRQFTLGDGLEVSILEPFRRMRVRYQDAARANCVDVTLTAAAPPAMRESCKHFEQMLDATGEVSLLGRQYSINGYGTRDRSWGEPRAEDAYPLPPYTWMTGRFPSGLMWTGNAHDDPARRPEWLADYAVSPKDVFKDGWLYRDGELLRLRSFSKLTRRDPLTARPVTHEINMTDAKGRDYAIRGEVISSLPWSGWPNMTCWICCTRWEWSGEVGFGDTQEVQWSDFVRRYRRNDPR